MKAKLVNEFLNEDKRPPVINFKQTMQILNNDLDNKNANKKRKPIMFVIKPEIFRSLEKERLISKIMANTIEYKSNSEIDTGRPDIITIKDRFYDRWFKTYNNKGQPMLIITDSLKKIPANIANQCDVAIIGGK